MNSSHWHLVIANTLTAFCGSDSEGVLETTEKSKFCPEISKDPGASFCGKSESLNEESLLVEDCPWIAKSMESKDRFAGELLCLSRSRRGTFKGLSKDSLSDPPFLTAPLVYCPLF